MSVDNKFPEMSRGQYALLLAEHSTGIVLGIDMKRDIGQGDIWRVFNSLNEAEEFARKQLEQFFNLEYVIRDYDYALIKHVDPSQK